MKSGSLTYMDLYEMWVVLDDLYPGYSHPAQSVEQLNSAWHDGIITRAERLFMADPDSDLADYAVRYEKEVVDSQL